MDIEKIKNVFNKRYCFRSTKTVSNKYFVDVLKTIYRFQSASRAARNIGITSCLYADCHSVDNC